MILMILNKRTAIIIHIIFKLINTAMTKQRIAKDLKNLNIDNISSKITKINEDIGVEIQKNIKRMKERILNQEIERQKRIQIQHQNERHQRLNQESNIKLSNIRPVHSNLDRQNQQDETQQVEMQNQEDPQTPYEQMEQLKYQSFSISNPYQIFQNQSKSPQYFINYSLPQKQINYSELEILCSKKISVEYWNQYIHSCLSSELQEKIKEEFNELQDENEKVMLEEFIIKLNKMSVKYIEAVVYKIPILKRTVSLKRVLHDLRYKYNGKHKERVNLRQFIRLITGKYQHRVQPSVDRVIEMVTNKQKSNHHSEQTKKQKQQRNKSKNQTGTPNKILFDHTKIPKFNLPPQFIKELKQIFNNFNKHAFLNYVALADILKRLKHSQYIQNRMDLVVRPKSHHEVQITVEDVIKYLTRWGPQFIDLDQFLMYFCAVRGFVFFHVQEKEGKNVIQEDSSIQNKQKINHNYEQQPRRTIENLKLHQPNISRIKSQSRYLPKNHKEKLQKQGDYYLSANNPNSIRNNNLSMMLQQKKQREDKQIQYKFKARPMPKSISKEKYQQFISGLNDKFSKNKERALRNKVKSQQELLHLKNNTKIFDRTQKQEIQINNQIRHEYYVKASPCPESTKKEKLNQIQSRKLQRKNKILSQTKMKYENDWQNLPEAIRKVQRQQKEKQLEMQQERQNFMRELKGQRLKIRNEISKEIPNYQEQHRLIQEELERRKENFQPTKIQEFHFFTSDRHPQHPYYYCGVDHNHYHENYHKSKNHMKDEHNSNHDYDYRKILYSPQPDIYYTQKFKKMVESNANRHVMRQNDKLRDKREEKDRERQHENFAKFMKKNLASLTDREKINQMENRQKIERHHKYWRNLDREYQHELNGMYEKILKRPFLYELQSPNYNKNKNKKKQADQIKIEIQRVNAKKGKKKQKNKKSIFENDKINSSF